MPASPQPGPHWIGIPPVIENIQDVCPETRRAIVGRFGSKAIAVSIDTRHTKVFVDAAMMTTSTFESAGIL